MRLLELARVAAGGARRRPLRTALTCLGVTIGSGALLSMVGFALGLEGRLDESLEKLQILNQLEVAPRPAAGAPLLDDAALARIAELPGVAAAYPDLKLGEVRVFHGERSKATTAVSVPPEAARLGLVQGLLVAGRLAAEGRDEAVMGSGLVRLLGFESAAAALGATLRLNVDGLAPRDGGQFEYDQVDVPVEVVGVYEPPPVSLGFGADMLLLPQSLLQRLPGSRFDFALGRLRSGDEELAPGYASALVQVDSPQHLADVQEEVRRLGFEAHDFTGRLAEAREFFLILDAVLFSVGTVALIIAGLGIANTLLMAVLERVHEIGLFKALGSSDGDVRWLFLTEAALVGLAGGLGGLCLGRGVSFLLALLVNAYARGQGVESDVASFRFPLWLHLGALAFSIAISLLSGWYPSARAARVDPIAALRSR